MEIRILGAHNIESKETGLFSLLIDGVLAIDAGALTSSLSFEEQQKLKAMLLTHPHYDHMRDIPALGMNFSLLGRTLDIYGSATAHDALLKHLLNGVIYPDFSKIPAEKPSLKLIPLEPGNKTAVNGYEVLAVSVQHAVPASGYQITSPDGKKVFLTSDTGPGLEDIWASISPDLLLTELTLPNKEEKFALTVGHLTPRLLQQQLESFYKAKKYLPQIVLLHMNPLKEKELKTEISAVEKELKTRLTFSRKNMVIKL